MEETQKKIEIHKKKRTQTKLNKKRLEDFHQRSIEAMRTMAIAYVAPPAGGRQRCGVRLGSSEKQ